MAPERGATWQILIPHRSRTDLLVDVAEACRELPTGDDRDVTRQIVLGELTNGSATTAGELLDKIEKASPAERRAMLEAARVKAGLESIEDIEFRARHEQAQRNARAAAFNAPPPRFALNDVGLVVNLAEQEVERRRASARDDILRRQREEREAQQAVAAEEWAAHERARSATLREQSRHQFPWQAA